MTLVKKQLLLGVAALLMVIGSARAQTALFIYDDGNGVPNAGTYTPGSSFTFAIDIAFTPGGSIANLEGLSYWFQQSNPGTPPYPFSITLRDVTGPPVGGVASGPSPFTDLQTPSLTYPQNLNPVNANDLGAAQPVGPASLGTGTYFVANITISIPLSAPTTGTFVISD